MIRHPVGRGKSRPIAKALSLLVATVLVAAACAGSNSGQGTADRPAQLRVLMSDDWAETAPFIEAVRTFEEAHHGVRVVIDKLGASDVLGGVEAMIGQGDSPDVVQGHAFAAAARHLAQPVDDLWEASHLRDDEYLPGAIEDIVWGGHHYGVPLDTNAVVLFYNAQQFAQEHLASPDTWKTFGDLETAARALSRADGSRRALILSNSTWRAYGWMAANGGELVDVGRDGTPRFTIDSGANVEALHFLRGLIEEGLAFHPSLGPVADDPISLIRSGAASMYTSGSNDLVTLRESGSIQDVKIALMPFGIGGATKGTAMGGSSLFIPNKAPNRALAFDFMRHVTSDRFALSFAKGANRLPVRPRVYADPFFQGEESRTVLTELQSAHVYRLEAFPVARQAFGDAVRYALSGTKDAQTALHDAQVIALASAPK